MKLYQKWHEAKKILKFLNKESDFCGKPTEFFLDKLKTVNLSQYKIDGEEIKIKLVLFKVVLQTATHRYPNHTNAENLVTMATKLMANITKTMKHYATRCHS